MSGEGISKHPCGIMRYLVFTQKVDRNDSVLGFFHDWVAAFALRSEQVTVVALSVGAHSFPKNVTVYSLGKEDGAGRITIFFRFFNYLFSLMGQTDAVFVHMNPVYVVLGGIFWRLRGKIVALWYTHRNVDWKLRIAVRLSNIVFTASPEGCRVPSPKVQAIGHGIFVARFVEILRETKPGAGEPLRILHVGRITPIKNCTLIVEAASLLRNLLKVPFKIVFVGSPVTLADEAYAKELLTLVRLRNLESIIGFTGAVRNLDMPLLYARADLSINATPTGGLDKAVLESMAAAVPVVTSNEAFRPIFGTDAASLMFQEHDADDLAHRLATLLTGGTLPVLGHRLRERVMPFDIPILVGKIMRGIEALKK